MARFPDEELNEIIGRALPGHRIVRRKADDPAVDDRPAAADRPVADEAGPDLAELRKKYGADTGSDEAPAADAEDTDAEIVIVEPKERTDPLDHGSRPKAVVVSGKERRVIGYQ